MVSSLSGWRRVPSCFLIIIILALFIATPQTVKANTNLASPTNASFESNPPTPYYWTRDQSGNDLRYTNAHTGTYSIRLLTNLIYVTAPLKNNIGGAFHWGEFETCTFWTRYPLGGNNVIVRIYFTDGTYQSFYPVKTVMNAWEQVSIESSDFDLANRDKWITSVRIYGDSDGTVYVDDFYLYCHYDALIPTAGFTYTQTGATTITFTDASISPMANITPAPLFDHGYYYMDYNGGADANITTLPTWDYTFPSTGTYLVYYMIYDNNWGNSAWYIANVTVTDLFYITDTWLDDGDAGGDWVFVSPKLYTFCMDHSRNATGFNLQFNATNGVIYNWDYDSVTGEIINDSPADGVSGTYVKTVGIDASNSRSYFKLKFNLPIADSLNVTLRGRVYNNATGEDTGLIDGQQFHIYNLGGFSTITASGWAGRLMDLDTGETIGDAFEIYSADSRTPFMIDSEKFGSDQTFGLLEWTREPLKDLPQWEFIQTGANAYTELKRDHIAENVPPYPFFSAIGVNGAPSSLHLISDDVTNYKTRASIQFRRRVTNEIVNASVWILVHTNDTYAKIRLADEDLHFVSGNEASTFEVKNFTMGYRGDLGGGLGGDYIPLLTHDLDTWYKVLMSVNLTNETQCVEIYNSSLTLLNSTGYLEMNQHTNSLEYWNIISEDGGGIGACDIYADELEIHSDFSGLYGGQIKSEMIFNKLQLWRQDFDFSIEEGSEYTKATYADYGFIELGVDYMVKGVWVNNALWARLNVTDSNISGKNNWVKYTVNWFEDDVLIRDDEIYGLFYGHSGADIGDARKDATGFHWSTWFNRANASTVIGARINPEFFGMSDKSPWWNILSSDWKPMMGDVDESTVYRRVIDANGDPATVKDIELVRVWERCYRTNASTFHYSIQNIREQNFQVSPNTMEGIDTPAIVKTMMPTMAGGFLGSALGAIFRGIIGKLGDSLLWGGMQVWTSFYYMIDVIASYLGAQGWFEYVLASVKMGMNSVTVAGGWIVTINGWIWTTLLYVFSWFTSIAFWLNLYSSMMWNTWGMMTGTYIGTTDVISQLNIPAFVMLFLIALPLIILERMGQNGVFPVIHEIQTVVGWGGWIYSYLAGLIAGFVDLVFQLIEAIPVVE